VLVLWALSLGALLGCLALAVNLGDLQQQATNTQDAADSAALAAAGQLGPQLPLATYPTVAACETDSHGVAHCPCPADLAMGCSNYKWLENYYIYISERGWLLVGSPQISAASAFAQGLAAGWSCSQASQHPKRCVEVSTNVTGSAPGALSDETTVANLAAAANAAQSLASSAYFASTQNGLDWASCQQPPSGFAIASSTDSCVAYEAGPSAYWPSGAWSADSDYIVLWVDIPGLNDGPSGVATSAWATVPGNTGPFPSPAPPFGPATSGGHSWLCWLGGTSSPKSTCPGT
jgi:hypothetical protein